MDFVLRIFFSGLITFIPNSDGTELTVAMVQTPHTYQLADGSTLAHHKPLLLARAAHCDGDCRGGDYASIAQFLYARKTSEQALTSLNGALQDGAAWQLSGDLSLNGPTEPLALRTGARQHNDDGSLHRIPISAEEREDFSWITDIDDLAPGTQGVQTAIAGAVNPGSHVAARLKLRSGKVMTYSVIKIDGSARPVHFRKPSGEGPDAPYTQALANWAMAEIRVPGDSIEIVEKDFADPEQTRSIRLTPMNNEVVEIALLNLPPYETPDPDAPRALPQPGQHFQIYYDLVKTPPAQADRLVPHLPLSPLASDPQSDWAALHPKVELWSDLLEGLNLNPRGKGPYEVALCPITRSRDQNP